MAKDFWKENPEFRELVEDLFGATSSFSSSIKFKLKPGQNVWLQFKPQANGVRHCYTPHKCTEGWYYAFDYVPQGKGSRSGKAKEWKLKNMVKFRKRKSACTRAEKRWYKSRAKNPK